MAYRDMLMSVLVVGPLFVFQVAPAVRLDEDGGNKTAPLGPPAPELTSTDENGCSSSPQDFTAIEDTLNSLSPSVTRDGEPLKHAAFKGIPHDVLRGQWLRFMGLVAGQVLKKVSVSSNPEEAVKLPLRPPVILIVQSVDSSMATVDRVKKNMAHLLQRKTGIFRWCFFHYDGNVEPWMKLGYYRDDNIVKRRETIPPGGCKFNHMSRISMLDLEGVDYVWFVDADVALTFTHFDIYAAVLAATKPFVSQPSVLAGSRAGVTTSVKGLTMKPAIGDTLVVASENMVSESMAPLLSKDIWLLVLQRMATKTTHCDVDLSEFWDVIAILGAKFCKRFGVTVVNSSPMSHLDCHTMPNQGSCYKDCDPDENRPISPDAAINISKVCDGIPANWLSSTGCEGVSLKKCRKLLWESGQHKSMSMCLNPDLPGGESSCQPNQGSL
eukprot:TRINITY_DN67762_c0_g1_i1.p1 TRINITY_DN67762_c0_g1~~TRINITY_DN67762_c0_g1_i1.p1  ORF type:complete len:469 (+),score=56.45 TRINITY_DN67762_c0_g1_i1:91-1407(+)